MQLVTKKTEKIDQCNNFQDEIGTELYEKLLGLKERLQLKFDHHWTTIGLVKKDSEKEEMKKNVSSCIMEKFKGFDIVSIEYDRRQRTKFLPIDIINKPVKK